MKCNEFRPEVCGIISNNAQRARSNAIFEVLSYGMQCIGTMPTKMVSFFCQYTFLIQFCQLGRRTTSKIPIKLISSMDPRHVSLLIQLLSVVQGFNNPLVDTRVYDKDYSVFLQGEINQSINHIQGVLVSESSWESSRLPPTVEKSIVSCATACIDKFRADFSCNAIMFVQETQECHFGNTTLTDENENEATEFVYRIPDGKGKVL